MAITQPTIIVVHYNTPELTSRLLSSLQYDSLMSQVILVDNDEHHNKWSSDIHVIRTGANIGHGPGLHSGITQSSSEWVLCLDSDTEIIQSGLIEYLQSLCDGVEQVYGAGNVVAVNHRGINIPHQPRPWQSLDGPIDRAIRKGIPYLHPYCALINRSAYFAHRQFHDHGAPCLNAMKSIVDYKLVHTNRLDEYVKHEWRGTRKVTTPSYLRKAKS